MAIVQFRRIMVDAARAFREGGPAIGTVGRRTSLADIRSYEGVVPKTVDWRSLTNSAGADVADAASGSATASA